MSYGSFATYMKAGSAIRVGWWMFWRGVWGKIRRRPYVYIEAGFEGGQR